MMKYTNEKGANHWLTSRPDKEKSLTLSCSDFRVAIRMRYAIRLDNLPTKCVCSADYTYSHTLQCSTGGFGSKRHNDLRDIIVGLARQVSVVMIMGLMLTPNLRFFRFFKVMTSEETPAKEPVSTFLLWDFGGMDRE